MILWTWRAHAASSRKLCSELLIKAARMSMVSNGQRSVRWRSATSDLVLFSTVFEMLPAIRLARDDACGEAAHEVVCSFSLPPVLAWRHRAERIVEPASPGAARVSG